MATGKNEQLQQRQEEIIEAQSENIRMIEQDATKGPATEGTVTNLADGLAKVLGTVFFGMTSVTDFKAVANQKPNKSVFNDIKEILVSIGSGEKIQSKTNIFKTISDNVNTIKTDMHAFVENLQSTAVSGSNTQNQPGNNGGQQEYTVNINASEETINTLNLILGLNNGDTTNQPIAIAIGVGLNNLVEALSVINDEDWTRKLDPTKIQEAIRKINEVFAAGTNSPVQQLFNNIRNISAPDNIDEIVDGIRIINGIVNAVSNIGALSVRRLIKSKLNIYILRNFLVEDIVSLYGTISTTSQGIDKIAVDFYALNNFINAIVAIGEISANQRRRMQRNIEFINEYIINSFMQLYNTIATINAQGENAKVNLSSLTGIIDSIVKIGDIGYFKMFTLEEKSEAMAEIIGNFFRDIITAINSVANNDMQGAQSNITAITNLMSAINNTISTMPSIAKIIGMGLKSTLLIGSITITIGVVKLLNILNININNLVDVDIDKLVNSFTVFYRLPDLKTIIKTSIAVTILIEVLTKYNIMLKLLKKSNILLNDIPDASSSVVKLDTLKTCLENVSKIADIVNNIKKIKDANTKLKTVNKILYKLITSGNNLIAIPDASSSVANLDALKTCLENIAKISDILNNIQNIKSADKKLKTVNKILDKIKTSNINLQDIPDVSTGSNKLDNFKTCLENIAKIANILNGIKTLKNADKKLKIVNNIVTTLTVADEETRKNLIESINDLNSQLSGLSGDVSKNIQNLGDVFSGLSKVTMAASLMSVLGGPAVIGMFFLKKEIKAISEIVASLSEISDKDLQAANKASNAVAKIMVISAITMLIGSMTMQFIDLGDLIAFNVAFTAFIFMSVKPLIAMQKQIGEAQTGVGQFALLITAMGGVLVLGSLIMNYVEIESVFKFLIGFAGMMLVTCLGMWALKKPLQQGLDGAKDAALLVAAIGFTLAFGSLIMNIVDMASVFKFLLGFAGMMIVLAGTMWALKKPLRQGLAGAQDAALLIATVGITLALGSLIMNIVDMSSVFKFLLGFAGMMLVVGLTMWATKGITSKGLNAGREWAILIATVGITLVLGSLVMNIVDWQSIGKFLLGFAGMMVVVGGAMWLAGKATKGALKSAKQFAVLVATCAAVLLIGALAMEYLDISNLVGFALIFGGFMLAICLAIRIAAKGLKKTWAALLALSLLVVCCAAVLMFGAEFIEEHGWKDAVLFAVIEVLFIGLMGLLVCLLGQMKLATIGKGILCMAGIVLIIYCSGLAFKELAAGLKDITWEQIGMYFTVVGALLLGVAGIGFLLSSNQNLALGMAEAEGLMLGIAVIIGAMGYAFGILADSLNKIGDLDEFNERLKVFAIVLGSVFAAVAIIGGVSTAFPLVGVAIAVGEALFLGLAVVIGAMAKAFGKLVTVVDMLSKVEFDPEDLKFKMKGMFSLFEGLPGIKDAAVWTLRVKRIEPAVVAMGRMMGKIAKGVKDVADLRIAEYTGTKITGYKQLTNEDFINAANNTKTIITTIGGAIIDLYNGKIDGINSTMTSEQVHQMFESSGPLGLGKSPFDKVVKSSSALGKMISKISEGVKDYADLRIPIYTGTKKTGYRQLGEEDFKGAAKNIKTVITTIGGAIIELYNGKIEGLNTGISSEDVKMMFNAYDASGSPFNKVINSVSRMGFMISMIAMGLQNYADLKIPQYSANSTKVTGYIHMGDEQISSAAETIKKVITAIGGAIISVYNEAPEGMFDSAWWKSKSDTPFNRVIDGCSRMTTLIVNVSEAVQKFAMMAYPDPESFDSSTGKYTKFRQGKPEDFKVAEENIGNILTALGKAVMNVYNDNKWLFNTGLFKPITESLLNITKSVSEAITTVQNFANLKMPIYSNGKITGWQPIKITAENRETIGNEMAELIKILPESFKKAVDECPIFSDNSFGLKIISVNNVFANITKSISQVSQSYIDTNENLKKLLGDNISDNTLIENIKTATSSMILGIVDIANIMSGSDESISLKGDLDQNWNPFSNTTKLEEKIGSVKDTFDIVIRAISNTIKSYIDTKKSIEKFGGSLSDLSNPNNEKNTINQLKAVVSSMIEGIVNICNTFTTNQSALHVDLDDVVDDIQDNTKEIVKAISAFAELSNLMGKTKWGKGIDKTISDDMIAPIVVIGKSMTKNKDAINASKDAIDSVKSSLVKMIPNLTKILTKYNEFSTAVKEAKNIAATPEEAKQLFNNIADISNLLPDVINGETALMGNDLKTIIANTRKFGTIFADLANTYKSLPEAVADKKNKFIQFGNGLSNKDKTGLLNKLTSVDDKNIKNIQKVRNELGGLVTNVNRLNPNRFSLMVSLATQMARLAEKFDSNGLAKLAQAIGENLTDATNFLSNTLEDTNKTIVESEKCMKKREESIKASVQEVRNAMQETIHVSVKAEQVETPNNPGDKQSPEDTDTYVTSSGAGNDWGKISDLDTDKDGKVSKSEISKGNTAQKEIWNKHAKQPK